jgi:DNA ligase-1
VRAFAALYAELDASTSTQRKVDALERHLRTAPAADAAWAVYLLAGGKPRQMVRTRVLREAARAAAGLPEWLFEECYLVVGDLAETIAHLLPPGRGGDAAGLATWMDRLLPLRGADPEVVASALAQAWDALDGEGRFVFNKLITGGFRVGVSRPLVARAVARVAGVETTRVAQRMVGYTDAGFVPDAAAWARLVAPEPAAGRVAATAGSLPAEAAASDATDDAVDGRPYPFFLAHPLQRPPDTLGPLDAWFAEWKWDGIRAQLVARAGQVWLWSRGEELVTERFPEIAAAAAALPCAASWVLDGEVLAWDAAVDRPLGFAALQTRIGRRRLSSAVLRSAPTVFVAYDLLEVDGADARRWPLAQRRERLQALIDGSALRLSPLLQADDWPALAALRAGSRERGVEGLMLKRRGSAYGVGRTRADGGDWWKWKVDPYTVDAVLLYAQVGHGRRAGLYTDYTFAVWDERADGRVLVPFAKAYSGLTDAEIREVDACVRRTTVERFGPVRSVRPELVMEIAFEAIARSPRHACGVAVRFPRILRWRRDKAPADADTLATLRGLLQPSGTAGAPPAPPAPPILAP